MECLLHIFDMRKGPKSGGEIQKSVEDPKINLIRLSGLHEKEFQKTVGKSREETN
jgi:hypothetical protein